MIRSILLKSILLVLLSFTSASNALSSTTHKQNRNLGKVKRTFVKNLLHLQPQVVALLRPPLTPTPRGGAAEVAVEKKESILQRHPFASACAITTLNAFLADLLTQLVFEKLPWNPKRSALFAAFGFLYQGMAQYAIVNLGWEKVLPGTKPKAVILKICGMNLLSDPLLFMPTFYIFKEAMSTGLAFATIKTALLSYKANCLFDWRNSWMVWFPGHAVTYGVMPTHKRIPWMAFVGFFYMIVLSITRGAVV